MDNIKFQIIDNDAELYGEQTTPNSPQQIQEPQQPQQMQSQPKHIKLCILTPCYGGQCHVNYVICLMKTLELFREFNIEVRVEFCKNDSLVSRARNNLMARAMSDPTVTHAMFIDSDITWNPLDIIKMLKTEKELIGGIYPLKHYEWSRAKPDIIQQIMDRKNASDLRTRISDETMIKCNMVRYNVNYLEPVLHIENNLAKVKHIATGFMLLSRSCFDKMVIAHQDTKYVDDVSFLQEHENTNAYALFDCGVRDGHYYSEDWLFCDRWSKIGGEIWIDVTINLTHTGPEDYEGSYVSSIV